ncbi:MAG: iron ABC transporter permease [Hyphomicrobium sp.]|nr:iron ABC transporter permease [Hyphomicrobium sp.]
MVPQTSVQETNSRRFSASAVLMSFGVLLALAAFASLAVGPTGISIGSLPRAIAAALGHAADANAAREQLVLIDIRLPRTLLAMLVGASLAMAGAMMQGMFRNPLADPALIGVSSGAALAAVATIALGHGIAAPVLQPLGVYVLPVAAFLGGIVTTGALVLVAGRHGQLMVGTLLLAGIAIAALTTALTGLIAFSSDDRELRDLTLWQLGSLGGANWPRVVAILPFVLLVLVLTPRLVRGLNGFLLGEAEAFHLGIDVERTKRDVVIVSAASVGAAVAVAGIIGFAGIVVPHIVRLLVGPDHRIVLPGSAMLGAVLMLLADIAARMLVRPAELPIGIVMAIIGAPLFLHLILKRGIGGME